MYHINITQPAEYDIKEAVKYITEQLLNPIAAGKLLDDAERAIFSLNDMPHRFALVKDDDLARLEFRFMPVNNYLIFYIIREETKTVVIQRFLYGRRDWATILKYEPE